MRLLFDAVLTLLSALGLALLGGLLFGRLLYPAPGPGLWVVIPGRGGGEGLERDLRALMWLRGLGLLRCRVAIADLGLTAGGRELALRLSSRWDDVVLWPARSLHELVEQEED